MSPFAALSGSAVVIAWALLGLQVILFFAEYYLWLRKIIGNFSKEYLSAVIVPVSLAAGMALMLAVSAPLLGNLSAVTLLAAEIALGALLYCALAWLFQREFVRAMAATSTAALICREAPSRN